MTKSRERWMVEYKQRDRRVFSEARGVGVADQPGTILRLRTGLYMVGATVKDPENMTLTTSVVLMLPEQMQPGSLTAQVARSPRAAADILVRVLGDAAVALRAVEAEAARVSEQLDRGALLRLIEEEMRRA